MVREVLSEKPISIPEVKEILDGLVDESEPVKEVEFDEEMLASMELDEGRNYYLTSTHEYVKIFSKMEPKVARNVIQNLVNEGIPIHTAIQIVNVDPDTVEELQIFFEKGIKRLSEKECEELLFKIRSFKEL
ncbi:MAG: hypothetical protein ACFFCS_08290 [Candidatus Hodarchaeota archaeon]